MAKYTLIGIDGNAYSIMGYTSDALKKEGLGDLVEEMLQEAKSSDYNNLLRVCMNYVEKANEEAYKNGYEEYEEFDDYEDCD